MNNQFLLNANALLSYQRTGQQKRKRSKSILEQPFIWDQQSIWDQTSKWIPKPLSFWRQMTQHKKMSPFIHTKSSKSTRSATPFRKYIPSTTRAQASATPVIMPRFTRNTMLPLPSSRTSTSMIVNASTPIKTYKSSKKKNLKNKIKKGVINIFKKFKNIIRKDNRKIKEKGNKKYFKSK